LTKSAQIPFSAWLPAAIAAPTPVSALVHSSTLVTAGVFLFIRFSPHLTFYLIDTLILIAILTSFLAGASAVIESDFKKIIALSTLSQLGLIILILRCGNYILSYFHLLSHALFKRLLFLCAGILIHNVSGGQDLRTLGGFYYSIPATCIMLNVSNLSLRGFPFLCGFYSKDLIVEYFFFHGINIIPLTLLRASLVCTRFYRFRILYYSIIIKVKIFSSPAESMTIVFPLNILFILTMVGGRFFS